MGSACGRSLAELGKLRLARSAIMPDLDARRTRFILG